MIRVLLVDDEPLARRGIRFCLRRWKDVVVAGEADSGEAGARLIRALRPDVVFLDVQMPDGDGFEMISSLDIDERPVIVMTTAYDNYALRAFGIRATDYLMKPLDDERFDQAMRSVCQRLQELRLHAPSDNTLAPRPDAVRWDTRLQVKNGGRTTWIPVDDIDWIEASGDYVTLHVGPRLHMIHASMDGIERRLDPARFARIHRSRIVPLSRIHGLNLLPTRDAVITLRDGTELRVSRRFRHRISLDRVGAVSANSGETRIYGI